MKITINTFGTRGDIQPYIALGSGLQQAGHEVRVLTHHIFQRFVAEHKLDFYPLHMDPRQVLISQTISELGNSPVKITHWLQENYGSVLREIFEVTLRANQGSEMMINSGLSLASWHVAEKLSIPALAAFLWPMTPSRHLMGAIGKIPPTWLPFRGVVNYYSTKLFNQLFYYLMLPLINTCRKDVLGLRPMKAREYWQLDSPQSTASIIYGYSETIVSKPPDWSNYQQITGYWFLDSAHDYQPEKDLLAFLEHGPPPVSVGFGSMVDHEKKAVSQIVFDALRATGQRAVLLGGWGELGSDDKVDFVFQADAIPHDWLFPHTIAAIHHGGAGTTAAAMRAGIPSVIVPWFGDQFFWGWRVQELGVGPKSIPRKQLTSTKLARCIQEAIKDQNMQSKAAEIGKKIRSENGVETAVKLIEKFAHDGHW